ncbi:hypothetical protein BHU72_14730 [Desulfuribacillus stibiiarsenatis]|uniref:AAA domain-containing protein n=1 Tax=Desulfuribacillus stibiiarsenatis TaxID=1390249 RepID=A0A1E5L791_9FIRM|nr:AAA family ATPase [Desulfuribacillus stibiiarsenatis]OEH86005.1 hypothetical protein BHU72_14730 [Desulfuribacillus stibiiarsenatis]
MSKSIILLDPHLSNSRLFPLLNEVYTVQVYMGIKDLPQTTDSWIVSKWTLIDGNATDIPKQFREKLIVIDEQASVEAWQKCKIAGICYTTEIGDMLSILRNYFDLQKERNLGNEIANSYTEGRNEKVDLPHQVPVVQNKLDEPLQDPFSIVQQEEDEEDEHLYPVEEEIACTRFTGKQVIAVTQKKGGTGKTTVTQTAARIIAERGQKILVIELDPDGGHLASRMNIKAKANINLLNKGYSLENVIERHTDKGVSIDYILSPDFSRREVVRKEVVRKMLREAREDYDVTIIDCGTAWDDTIITAINFATQVWMVSTPDHAALLDGRVLYTKLVQNNVDPEKIIHIINKSMKSKDMSLAKIQENVPISKLYLLPEDNKVCALQQQKKEPTDCKFGKKLREVIEDIVPFEFEEEEDNKRWWQRLPLIRRLFSA